jgi:beta-glucosidase
VRLDDPRFDDLIERLDLITKVRLLTGRDFWSTWPVEEIGLRSMVLSDGPSGVRGPIWDERSPSLNLPSATALASSWDLQLAREYGAVAASEARRKGVDIVLGPTINLHRSPLGGRHFEAFSEDPVLTSELAAAYVAGVQENGVGATPKHYVANDFETERFTADVKVDEQTLRELYLLAFEKSVTESHAWLIMSAYNSINGRTATENDLLETPLNSEWGFDGVVVSDWTAVRSLESATSSQDLVMPGPTGPWGGALVAAVMDGRIDESVVDRKVRRLLLLAARVGALEGFPAPPAPKAIDGREFIRRAGAEGAVLVSNDGILPLSSPPRRIAVIGHNADIARSQGGGSATVLPEHVISPLEGVREAFPDSQVDFAIGAVAQPGISDIALDQLHNPATGEPGVHLEFVDASGSTLFAEERYATSFVWFGGDAPILETRMLQLTTRWTPPADAQVHLGFAAVGRVEIDVDGVPFLAVDAEAEGEDLGAALLSPSTSSRPLATRAGESLDITIRYLRPEGDGPLDGLMSFAFGLEADDSDPEALIAEAEQLAADADVVVLVVGTNARVESEGFDRNDLALPGRQDELARRVIAANPRTIAVVNSGSPVELPWSLDAAAVLLTWFGGQEYGAWLGDVLSGRVEPGGRLPTTWPKAAADAPVLDVTPIDGELAYSEGIDIGYRAWLGSRGEPAFWFGSGMGYTTFVQDAIELTPPSPGTEHALAVVTVRNVGERAGKHVVQIYAERATSRVRRPARWLVGFAAVHLPAGGTADVSVPLPARRFASWVDAQWFVEPGDYALVAASDAGGDGPRAILRFPSI